MKNNQTMPTKEQNELWRSLDRETKKNMVIEYNSRLFDNKKVGFLETLYGKENLENFKLN